MTRLRLFAAHAALTLAVVSMSLPACAAPAPPPRGDAAMHAFVDKLLARMTIEEKAGQLSILGADHGDLEQLIREGRLGGTNGVLPDTDVLAYTRRMQELAMHSRLKIPLWFMGDVNHGFRTIFPVPLALAATWDTALVRRVHRAAAGEATAAGVDWTFSPMVDISRDPRWGRGVEGAGEDPFLGAAMARAQVEGFQGHDLSDRDTMMATAKHFAGYGAAVAGRDYNPAYLPRPLLWDVYFPPFRAAVDDGIGAVMPSLTALNGIPATGDHWLLTDVLRKQWGFRGVVVSDYDAVSQLVTHGVAKDAADATRMALDAGVDIDLHDGLYLAQLPALVRSGKVPMRVLDDAVRRVLDAKYRLGLFRDPFRYDDPKRLREVTGAPRIVRLARHAAAESMVLLVNRGGTLPLSRNRNLAVIGPLATDRATLQGQMPALGRPSEVTTILEGIRAAAGSSAHISYTRGVDVRGDDVSGIPDAVRAARAADVAVLVLGEDHNLFGEGLSRSHLGLPGHQLELAQAVVATGKPVVVMLINGRPLALPWLQQHADAILEAWVPGNQGGPAVADVLYGAVDPSGKLPMTFPRDVGQVPIYYAHARTGRPLDTTSDQTVHYTTHYVDVPNTPLFPFGYGLSYTHFAFGPVRLDRTHLGAHGALHVRVRVRNTGARRGAEVVQLYVHDRVASRTPPVRQLKGFRRVTLDPGASADVEFTLRPADLAFDRSDGSWGTEPGDFDVYVGGDSTATDHARFTLDAASPAHGDDRH